MHAFRFQRVWWIKWGKSCVQYFKQVINYCFEESQPLLFVFCQQLPQDIAGITNDCRICSWRNHYVGSAVTWVRGSGSCETIGCSSKFCQHCWLCKGNYDLKIGSASGCLRWDDGVFYMISFTFFKVNLPVFPLYIRLHFTKIKSSSACYIKVRKKIERFVVSSSFGLGLEIFCCKTASANCSRVIREVVVQDLCGTRFTVLNNFPNGNTTICYVSQYWANASRHITTENSVPR